MKESNPELQINELLYLQVDKDTWTLSLQVEKHEVSELKPDRR